MQNDLGTAAGALEPAQAFLDGLFVSAWSEFVCGGFELDINEIITISAVDAGLVECVDFDPDQHIDDTGSCSPGDEWYQITEAGRQILCRAKANISPPQDSPNR